MTCAIIWGFKPSLTKTRLGARLATKYYHLHPHNRFQCYAVKNFMLENPPPYFAQALEFPEAKDTVDWEMCGHHANHGMAGECFSSVLLEAIERPLDQCYRG